MAALSFTVRRALPGDAEAMTAVAKSTAIFSPDELEHFGAQIARFCAAASPTPPADDFFVAQSASGELLGMTYLVREAMTDGVFNLTFIGVKVRCCPPRSTIAFSECGVISVFSVPDGVSPSLSPAGGAAGIGSGHITACADTGGGDDFKAARRFYERAGFAAEATTADYWGKGEAKITFTKRFA